MSPKSNSPVPMIVWTSPEPSRGRLRIALASGVLYAASILYSAGSRILIAAELIALGVGYVVLLFALGELGREDLRLIRRVLGKA